MHGPVLHRVLLPLALLVLGLLPHAVHAQLPPTLILRWSFAGPLQGQRCVHVVEPSDRHGWDDNFLCSTQPALDLQWSSAGPIAGKHCVQLLETADLHTWNDNFLCSSNDYGMVWSSAGPLPAASCVQINEPADPDTWEDNFLCFTKVVIFSAPPQVSLRWSFSGPIAGSHCVAIAEPADPHTWDDNFLCTQNGLGLRWSNSGRIAGMFCVAMHESANPAAHTWADNFLCTAKDFGMEWSSAGPLPGRSCIQINEPADPHTWDDNFLCFSKAVLAATPTTPTAVCASNLPVTPITSESIDAAQAPGRVLVAWMLNNQRDAILTIVDDAADLGPDQLRLELDIDPNAVAGNKVVEARAFCHGPRVAMIESSLLPTAVGAGVIIPPLSAANDFRSGLTRSQTMLINRASTAELLIRRTEFLGIWWDTEVMDARFWQAFGGRSVRFIWRFE
jgi:hypothetical protein